MNSSKNLIISFVFLSLIGSQSVLANLPKECHLAKNWNLCKDHWERMGLSQKRLNLLMDLAADAYLPYDQVANGQEPDLKQPLIVGGKIDHKSKHNYSSKIKKMPQNAFIFKGITGTYGLRNESPMGFVYYEPSDFEKALIAHPKYIRKGMKSLLSKYSTRRLIVVAFRGTRHILYDLAFTDGSTRKKLAPGMDGKSPDPSLFAGIFQDIPKVHGGFLTTFESTFPEVQQYMKHFMYERLADLPGLDHDAFDQLMRDTEVVVTGHSLGGALAQICGYVLGQRPDLSPNKPTVYTFSQPKAGNRQFVEHIDTLGVAVFRIYRETDLVPKVPGILPLPGLMNYEHGGEELELDDISHAENLWSVAKIMPRHSIEKINQELKALMSEIAESVDSFVNTLATDLEEILGDFEEIEDHGVLTEGGITSLSTTSQAPSLEKRPGLAGGRDVSLWRRILGFFLARE